MVSIKGSPVESAIPPTNLQSRPLKQNKRYSRRNLTANCIQDCHCKQTKFQTCHNAAGSRALQRVDAHSVFQYTQDRTQGKWRIHSKIEGKLIFCTHTASASAAVFNRCSLWILRSLHSLFADRSEAPSSVVGVEGRFIPFCYQEGHVAVATLHHSSLVFFRTLAPEPQPPWLASGTSPRDSHLAARGENGTWQNQQHRVPLEARALRALCSQAVSGQRGALPNRPLAGFFRECRLFLHVFMVSQSREQPQSVTNLAICLSSLCRPGPVLEQPEVPHLTPGSVLLSGRPARGPGPQRATEKLQQAAVESRAHARFS
nr:uncharacterized protein LOC105880608 [Microcebus murinus]